jgi:hypothetical protein
MASVLMCGLTSSAMVAAAGTRSTSSSNRFASKGPVSKVTPVMLPSGRLRLATRPAFTGSAPTSNTIGIVEVAAFAARAETVPPAAKMTSTFRRTRSAASSGRRS